MPFSFTARKTRRFSVLFALTIAFAIPAAAGGHEFDHPAPAFSDGGPLPGGVNSGGKGQWSLIKTFPTANPHTDLDFFTSGGETYVAVGTLAAGPNAGGQTVLQLTDGDKVDPAFTSGFPSAACISSPAAALGLQHDVEATPKGDVIFNSDQPAAVTSDAQLLIDATDAAGRCHDQGTGGVSGSKRGGLEIVDITDPTAPVEIGLTSHIGEAHTVNVDPKRPHIALAVTSDSVGVSSADGHRTNEDSGTGLDGFELVDLSTCMNFPDGTSTAIKREVCRPEVYRYRYPSTGIAKGTETGGVNGCHETEFYADDKLTCAAIAVSMVFDISGAFDDNGTPEDFSDDKPNGTPLPCTVRGSSTTLPGFGTDAMITDCVDGTGPGTDDLIVSKWRTLPSPPSLEGVEIDGVAFHMGRGGGLAAAQNIDVSHEAELTASGETLLVTDERGGGVTPPDASCSPEGTPANSNGGIHAYATDQLDTERPADTAEADDAYALGPDGKKAVFRATTRTLPQGTFCTAHVFQQIPGENRIFMAWYSQGTRVIDFYENPDGTFAFEEISYFIPEDAESWTSQIFKIEKNQNGSTTYYGVTGDFGRAAIDIYKVTMPGAPKPPDPTDPPVDGPCKTLFTGTDRADTFTGTKRGEHFRGRDGSDKILGRAGDDCLIGNGGRDDLNGGSGDDLVKGGPGADLLIGGPDDDTIRGNSGRDVVRGGGGDDDLRGGAQPDRIKGDGGNDTINVRGGGVDTVNCGKGIDTVKAGPKDRVSKAGCENIERRG